jgi:hypothetical protein
MQKLYIIIVLISLFSASLFGQSLDGETFISRIVGDMQESEVSESVVEDVASTLGAWSEYKPNINTLEADELLSYKLISPMQAAEISSYKQKNGDILSPYELVYISTFTEEDILRLTAILSFGAQEDKGRGLKQYTWGRHETLWQYNRILESKEGYRDDTYQGQPGKAYIRYRYKYGQDLSMGITAEKDPGEAFFSGDNKEGFDYYSMHFFVQPERYLSAVALGDYQVTLGQGLICGQGIWGSKNAATISNRNANQGFKPYGSAMEYGFMRGAALESTYKNIRVGAFASYQNIDATVDTAGSPFISSLSATGLHRTESEMKKKNAANEFITGGYVEGRFGTMKLNLNGIYTKYEYPVQRSTLLYDLYDPDGSEFANMSMGYMYQLKKFTFFGELAYSSSEAWAQLHSMVFYPSEAVGLSLLYRNYDKEYLAIHGYAFGETTTVQNQEGYYFGLEWLPFKYTQVNFYADFFKFPWLRYGEKAPTDGSEFFTDISFAPKRHIRFETRFKYEEKSVTESVDKYADLVYGRLLKWRIQGTFDYTPDWSGQARLAYNQFDQDSASYNGWLLYYEHFYEPEDGSISMSVRMNIFDVEDYLARIYTYERDVLYSFSVPSFQDTGIRYYFNVKWDVLENLTVYARIDRTEYLHRKDVGSGNELVNEPYRTGIHTKVKWTF